MKFLSFPALAQVGALLAVTAAGKPGTVTTPSVCTLTGTYKNGTDLSSCSNIVINSLSVPAGVTLDLSNLKDGASITFQGTTTFGTQNWRGPLVQLTGKHLKVGGSGVLDGQGSWYWPQGQNATKPKFFFVTNVSDSHLSDFRIQNMPVHTFYIMGSQRTVLERITIDSRLGDGVAKNTDGFGLNISDHITIQNCHVNNQDDCLAMQSSTNTFFLNNYCSGGHGISIGSLGGAQADWTDTVDGILVANNRIVNNTNGIRIKTLVDKFGAVTNIKYINNSLENVDNAIVVHSDYSKTAGVNAKGGYTGNATSHVTISNITINGLSGTATNLYDIFVNPAVSSNWQFSGIAVTAKSVGSCLNQPSNIKCT